MLKYNVHVFAFICVYTAASGSFWLCLIVYFCEDPSSRLHMVSWIIVLYLPCAPLLSNQNDRYSFLDTERQTIQFAQ